MASSNDMPDKKLLYGEWLKGETWKRALQKKLSHKALDIAEAEDVNLSVNKSTGIGATGLVAAALAAGLGPTILAGAILWQNRSAQPTPTTAPASLGEIELTWEWDGEKMTFKPKGK